LSCLLAFSPSMDNEELINKRANFKKKNLSLQAKIVRAGARGAWSERSSEGAKGLTGLGIA